MKRPTLLHRQIVVRMPDELYDEIEAAALANERTIAQEVRLRLKQHRSDGARLVPDSFITSVLYSGSFDIEALGKLRAEAETLLDG